jgi:adenosine kinase
LKSVDRLERGWGGTGGNIAYTLTLLGDAPVIVSAVGRDGDAYLNYLEEKGIDSTRVLKDDKLYTASAHITTDKDNNQVTAFYNGPLEKAHEISVYDLKQKFALAIIAPTAKVHDSGNAALEQFADHHLPGDIPYPFDSFLGARFIDRCDEDGTIILDIDRDARLIDNLVDHLAARADDIANLLGIDVEGDNSWRIW